MKQSKAVIANGGMTIGELPDSTRRQLTAAEALC